MHVQMAGLDLLVLDCAAALRASRAGPIVDTAGPRTIRTTGSVSRCCAKAGAEIAGWRRLRVSSRISSMSMTGRRLWRRSTCGMPRRRRSRASSPSTTSPSRASSVQRSFPISACPHTPGTRRSNITATIGYLKSGLLTYRLVAVHGQPLLCRGNPDTRIRHGPRRPHRHAAPPTSVGIVNGIDADRLEPRNRQPDPLLPSGYSATLAQDSVPATALPSSSASRSNGDDGPIFCVISRLTWQKGHGHPGLTVIDGIRRDRCADWPYSGSGDSRHWKATLLAAAARHRGRIGVVARLR